MSDRKIPILDRSIPKDVRKAFYSWAKEKHLPIKKKKFDEMMGLVWSKKGIIN